MPNDDMVIYLAGPVANMDDGGAGWRRDIVADWPDCEFANPLEKYNVPATDVEIVDPGRKTDDGDVTVRELVEADKELLRDSDAILVGYSRVRSVGTPMEVMWAHERGLPIAIWIRDDTSIRQLSPWYREHAGFMSHGQTPAVRYLINEVRVQK